MIQLKHSLFHRIWSKHRLRFIIAAVACLLILSPTAACSAKTPAKSAQTKKASASSAVSRPASSSTVSAVSPASAVSAAKEVKKAAKSNILKVKNIQQMPQLQSGCEITAANIILNYLGYNTSKTDLLKYLPYSNDFKIVNGKQYGPNPWKTFAGSPDADHYGCYAPVIANTMNEYLLRVNGKHTAYDLTGTSPEKLYSYVDHGIPIIVWVTAGMQEPSCGNSWYLTDNGKNFQWILKEHCMVLIGYNENQAIFSDPLDKRGTVSYNKSLFEERYQQLYSQAVGVD